MKKLLNIFFLAAAASLMMLSCSKDESEEKSVGKITVSEAQSSDIVFSDEGGSQTFEFNVNKNWTAAVQESDTHSWVSLSPTSGIKGDKTITITVAANEEYDERTASVVITCEEATQTISITQKQKGALILSQSSFEVPAAGETIEVLIKENSTVTATVAEDAAEWIIPVETKGLNETTLYFQVLENSSTEARTGTVSFSNESGSDKITVSQEGAAVFESQYGDSELEKVTTETIWAGSIFDNIITASDAAATEYISADGVNFINEKLGYLAGSSITTAEDGTQSTVYGMFKFKKDEKAYTDGTKMSRVQFGGTGVVNERNNLQFRVAGPGAVTLIARSSGDETRYVNFAIGLDPVSETGYEAPDKSQNSVKISLALDTKDGDVVSVYSMGKGINIYSLKWVPGGSAESGDDDPGTVDPGTPDIPSETELVQISSTTSWAPTFAELASTYMDETGAAIEITSSFIKDKLGFVTGGSKFKFAADKINGVKTPRAQFGGAGVPGKKSCMQFRVAGNGTVHVYARSASKTEARNLYVALGQTQVAEVETPAAGESNEVAPITLEKEIQAAAGDTINVYAAGGVNVYDLKWVPEGASDTPDPVTGEGDELDCPNPPTQGTVELDKMYGYAAAAGVTGGEGATAANILHFNKGQALQTWLLARTKSEKKGDHSPVIIWLSGTFDADDGRDFSSAHPWFDVKDVSNISFYGTDSFVMDKIGIFCVRASNIIIRNINFQQPKADNGADAVSMQECDGVWVDHCTFTSLNQTKDYEDGSTDITHGSKNVTVSWCRYVKTQKSCLVGHSNSESGDTEITATFHHNWFEGSSSRHPRVRFGRAHVYNNFFDGNTTYGVGSAYGAKVLVEYNYFDSVQLPTDICTYPAKENGNSNLQGSLAGYLWATQDIYVNKPAKAKDPYPLTNIKYTSYNGTTVTPLTYADFKPAYDYIVTAAADVPAVVKAGAGYGKLDGFASAPVDVNNGGITDFDATDDDQTDPDTGDEDDSGDEGGSGTDNPATGLSEGWSWIANGEATATYALSDSQLSISSNGKWESGAQKFGAVYREVTGDFEATVRLVSFTPAKVSNQGVAGIIAAEDITATATNLVFALSGGNYYARFRTAAGSNGSGSTLSAPATSGGVVILRLVREGNKLKASYSLDGGATFGNASSKEYTTLSDTLKIGLAANSADNSKSATAVFADFKIGGTTIAF